MLGDAHSYTHQSAARGWRRDADTERRSRHRKQRGASIWELGRKEEGVVVEYSVCVCGNNLENTIQANTIIIVKRFHYTFKKKEQRKGLRFDWAATVPLDSPAP